MSSPAENAPRITSGFPDPSGGRFAAEWLSPGRFALLLAALILAMFPDVLLADRGFVFRDFGIFTYPNAFFQRESFWRGEFPLWNPLNNCGTPFLAQWNLLALYPPSLIYLLLPLTWGLTIFLLIHLFLAGFNMYWLACAWTGNRLAGGLAGLAFAFNGLTLNSLMWTSTLAAMAWAPLVVLLVERAWRLGGPRPVIVAGLVSALQLLTGTPEVIGLTWMVLLALGLENLIRERKAILCVRAGAVVAVAALLCAAQLLPFLDLLAHSGRSGSFGAGSWSIPLWGWVNLLVPLFHCYRSPLGVCFLPGEDWTSSYYPGIAVVALGLAAVFWVRTARVRLLAALALAGFLLALGDAGLVYAGLLKVFPWLGFMRFPVKFVFLTGFALPLLAAFAVARLHGPDQERAQAGKRLGGIFIALALLAGGIMWQVWGHPFPLESRGLVIQNAALRVLFLGVILGGVAWLAKAPSGRPAALGGVVVLLLLWLELFTALPRQNPTVNAGVFMPGLAGQQFHPAPQAGESRAFLALPEHNLVYGSMLAEADKDYLGRRCALLGDCNLLDGIPVADGFYALYVREQRELFNYFFLTPAIDFPAGFADFLAISQRSDPAKLFSWQYRPSHLPFYSVGARPEFVERSNIPALLLATNFDARRVVYLPPEARGRLAAAGAAGGVVRQAHFAAQRVELAVQAEAPALLVLSQTYYHPWRAYVNGRPAPIWRADYAFQAVEVPAGASTVKLVYEDRLFEAGLALSGLALLGCLWGFRRAGRNPD